MSTANPTHGRLVRTGEASRLLFGDERESSKKRLIRWADRGLVPCRKVGPRGDRVFSTSALARLIESAEADPDGCPPTRHETPRSGRLVLAPTTLRRSLHAQR